MASAWDQASTVAIAVSALATAGMAFFTFRLATKTKSLSEAAEREAQAVVDQGKAIQEQADAVAAQAQAAAGQLSLTQQTLATSVQPWLTLGEKELNVPGLGEMEPLSYQSRLQPAQLSLSLAVRNVGLGMAIIDPKRSYMVGWPSDRSNDSEPRNYSSGKIKNPVLPPGEQTRISFHVDLERWLVDLETLTGQHRNDGEFFIDVSYGDALGLAATTARFHIARDKARQDWIVFEIAYFTPPNADEPQLTVRF